MGVYDRQIATAQRMIREKGAACVWEVPTASEDLEKPWIETEGAPVAHDTHILFLPMESQYSELLRFLKGTEIVAGKQYALMGAVAFSPEKTGIITRTLDGKKFGVVAADPLAPNGEVVFWALELSL